MKGKTLLVILIVIGVGAVLGWSILQINSPTVANKSSQQTEEPSTNTETAKENYIELTPEAQQRAGIKVKMAGPAQIQTFLELPGEIQFNQNRLAHVVPQVEGVVAAVYKHLGDPVEKGELIAVLESRELADLKSQYYTAIKRQELAQLTYNREKRLWEEKISAKQDYLAAKTALAEARIAVATATQRLVTLGLSPEKLNTVAKKSRLKFSRYPIRAPFKGRVVRKHIVRGEVVRADAELFVIADLSTVWGVITVYTKDLNKIHLGQKVTVRSKALGMEATGTISYIGYLIDLQTRSTNAHVNIPNPEERWRPGLFVTVEVAEKKISVPVAVTTGAIQTYQDQPTVFVQQGNGFEARTVTLGRRSQQWIEVVNGLSAGEHYAASNSFVLKSELGKSTTAHHH